MKPSNEAAYRFEIIPKQWPKADYYNAVMFTRILRIILCYELGGVQFVDFVLTMQIMA